MKRPLSNKKSQQRDRKRRRASPEEAEKRFRDTITSAGGTVIGPYKGVDHRVECRCKKNHPCYPFPNNILRGRGMCKTCAGQDTKDAETRFRKLMKELDATVIGPWTGTRHPIECLCKNNHKCHPRPYHVLSGQGICLTCVGLDPKVAEAKFRKHIEEELGGTVQGKYVNSQTPIECICKNKHKCTPRPCHVVQGYGMCAECGSPKGERAFGSLLRKVSENVKHKFHFKKWEFDYKVGNCLFEFDGGQHFRPSEIHGGITQFTNYQRPRDIAMTRAALKEQYRVVRVDYHWIYKNEQKQLQFLREALASSETLLVSHLTKYQWLEEEGLDPAFLSM